MKPTREVFFPHFLAPKQLTLSASELHYNKINILLEHTTVDSEKTTPGPVKRKGNRNQIFNRVREENGHCLDSFHVPTANRDTNRKFSGKREKERKREKQEEKFGKQRLTQKAIFDVDSNPIKHF